VSESMRALQRPDPTRLDSTGNAPILKSGADVTVTFSFVDIAGYTALTETHGEHAAADHEFEGRRYWFCSTECSEQFANSPSNFIWVRLAHAWTNFRFKPMTLARQSFVFIAHIRWV
jgi:YHS domain-containing protein